MDKNWALQLLEKAEPMFLEPPEPTIFSIGGRGYYENVNTDMLAFFMDPNQPHELGNQFLECFFEALGLASRPQELNLIRPPLREVVTESGKRIDLLLVGDTWILALENKIYHQLNNPWEDYEAYLHSNYPDKKPLLVVLSPSGEQPKVTGDPTRILANWQGLKYEVLVEALEGFEAEFCSRLEGSKDNKWLVYLKDYLLNLKEHTVKKNLEDDVANFFKDNFHSVERLLEMRNRYLSWTADEMLNLIKEQLPEGAEVKSAIDYWEGLGPALRFYSKRWQGRSNITLHLDSNATDQHLKLFLYVYGVSSEQHRDLDEALSGLPLKKSWPEGSIRCYQLKNSYASLNEARAEIKSCVDAFDLMQQKQLKMAAEVRST